MSPSRKPSLPASSYQLRLVFASTASPLRLACNAPASHPRFVSPEDQLILVPPLRDLARLTSASEPASRALPVCYTGASYAATSIAATLALWLLSFQLSIDSPCGGEPLRLASMLGYAAAAIASIVNLPQAPPNPLAAFTSMRNFYWRGGSTGSAPRLFESPTPIFNPAATAAAIPMDNLPP